MTPEERIDHMTSLAEEGVGISRITITLLSLMLKKLADLGNGLSAGEVELLNEIQSYLDESVRRPR